MRRSSREKITKVFVCLGVLVVSPFITAWFIKSMPAISVFAGKIANISAELTLNGKIPGIKKTIQSESDDHESFLFDDSFMISRGNPIIDDKNSLESANGGNDEYTGPQPYPESIETHSGKITSITYLEQTGTTFFKLKEAGQVRNATKVDMGTLMMEATKQPDFKVDTESGEEPQVLIMHTHTTESFEPYARDFYDASFGSRTTQENMNVVAVGEEIAKQIRDAGIGVIHDKTIHDYPSYNGSYERSRATVQAILAQHPSIKVVFDVHRDAIENEENGRVAPVTTINDKQAAQIMIISGCDNGTMNMPNYMQNFHFACYLQQHIESMYPTLTRPLLFTYKKYNQDLTNGSLLIEVGGHGNSIDQVKYTGELVGKAIGETLNSLK